MPRPNRGVYLVDKPRRLPSGVFVWVARWFEGGRKRERILGPGSRADAEKRIVEFREERRAAEKGLRDPDHYPIDFALSNYVREHAPSRAGAATIGYNVAALAPFFGKMMVSEITPEACRKYARQRKVKPATIARELTTLAAALNHDRKEGRLTLVPHIPMPPQPPAKDRWLSPVEAAALIRAARHDRQARSHLTRFIVLALYTAARSGAILDLRWNQVKIEQGLIDFNPPGRTQTKKGRAIVPISRRLMTLLRRWKAKGRPNGYVINIAGQPVGSIKKSFKAAAKRAKGKLADVTPHTLRHTSATWMAQRGVPLFAVAKFLGQKVAGTTEKYAHSDPEFLAGAAAALDRRLKP